MPRTKTTPAASAASPETTVITNAEVLTAEQHKAVERTTEIITRFGDGLPFDEARYEHVIRGHLSRSAEEMLAAGRALIVAKEMLGYGQWTPFIGRIGLEPRLAQRMMQSALKFSNAALTTHLVEAAGSKTKLFELLTLDDDEIKELSEGGTVAGLELDDIAKMSASELRKALRDEREEARAKDQVLADRNAKLDKVEASMKSLKRKIQSMEPDEELLQLRQEFTAETSTMEATIRSVLRDGVAKLRDHGMESGEADLTQNTFIAAALHTIRQALDDLQGEFGLPAMKSDETPEWAKQA